MTEEEKQLGEYRIALRRKENIREHTLLNDEIKVIAEGIQSLGKQLLVNPEYSFDVQAANTGLLSLPEKQSRCGALSTQIAEDTKKLKGTVFLDS
ncbi:hypothetical protein [Acidicapsa ligni]|uniref:hypothetical protein n=1 Tax=Acidicapsa ligni TaxID=542300 RepID=UPI0021E02594|nr:hypothetical protein [Acidicapsa ligni]